MKVHRIVCLVIDPNHPNMPAQQYAIALENCRHVDPSILSVESAEIGEWEDENPLNRKETRDAEVKRLFDTPPVPTTAAEIIARHKALKAQYDALGAEMAALPTVAMPWDRDGDRLFLHDPRGMSQASIADFGDGWEWMRRTPNGCMWHKAEPNTEAGAKACADAALLADGVVLA